jgi:hypothetical protein
MPNKNSLGPRKISFIYEKCKRRVKGFFVWHFFGHFVFETDFAVCVFGKFLLIGVFVVGSRVLFN